MNNFQQTGRLAVISEPVRRSDKFITREFVIETQGQYPQLVAFQLVQDRVSAIDAFQIDEQVTVHFDLRGREWQGKFFTNLQAWRIDKAGGDGVDDGTTTQTHAPAKPEAAPMDWTSEVGENGEQVQRDDNGDLPF